MPKAYTYESITQHCFEQITRLIDEATRRTGHEARYRQERAYGIYIGWRALVAEHTPPEVFYGDDRRLEAILKSDKMHSL